MTPQQQITYLEAKQLTIGLNIQEIAELRALKNPNEVSLFDSMEIFKPQ